jgi:hypothetical protein
MRTKQRVESEVIQGLFASALAIAIVIGMATIALSTSSCGKHSGKAKGAYLPATK